MIPTVIGIDLGTTTITALAVDTRTWQVIACETAPTPRLDTPPGRSESDADAIVRAAGGLLEKVRTDPRSPVGVTGQQHGVVVVDDGLNPLTPLIGWQDRRADGAVLEKARALVGDTSKRTGCRLSNGYGAVTLFALKEEGRLPRGTACTLMDFFVARLNGEPPVTDPTCAASLGCYDVVRGVWDAEILGALGLPPEMFPEVRPTHTHLGDNQASFLGSVTAPDTTVLVNVGTGGQVSAYSPDFRLTDTIEARPFPGGGYLLVSAGLCGGASLAALTGLFATPPSDGLVGRVESSRPDSSPSFGVAALPEQHRRASKTRPDLQETSQDPIADLVSLAESVPPGCDGLVCEPYFHGSRHDPAKRASFTGITAANLTPGHMARAVMEGMARIFAASYDRLKGLRGPAASLAGAGNGLRANPLLCRMVEEAFGMPLALPPHREEAAFGAALVAAVGAGFHPGFLHARTVRG